MMIASAVVFAGFGFFEIYNGIAGLAFLLFPAALIFGVTGAIYLRIAKRKEQHDNAA